LAADGTKLGAEFQVNQVSSLNQRNPALAPLGNGGFVVSWVSEQSKSSNSASFTTGNVNAEFSLHICTRLYAENGAAQNDEMIVSGIYDRSANPSVAAGFNGGYTVVWSYFTGATPIGDETTPSGWDVLGASFNVAGEMMGSIQRINDEILGDQFAPKIATLGSEHLVVWSSISATTASLDVMGRTLDVNGALADGDMLINSDTHGRQIYPSITSDGNFRYLVSWSSFVGGLASYDLKSQRFSHNNPLEKPATPYLSALSQSALSVTWAEMAGYDVAAYMLYVDEASTPILLSANSYRLTGLAPGSVHQFKLAYELTDGRISPVSDAISGTTWSEDDNFDGLPDDWQNTYWPDSQKPYGFEDSDGDGATNVEEFLAGTNPIDAESVLRTKLSATAQGRLLYWNSEAGSIYQVQASVDCYSWQDIGDIILATEGESSILIESANAIEFYRVIRLR
jgi:hypothetical protein